MIFVTAAGSTLPFDDLVRKIDELVGKGIIRDIVIIQIGDGEYIPKNCNWFRFEKSLDKYINEAEIVITHSGAGTLFELVKKKKKTICVINPKATNNPDIVIKLSKKKHIIWCKNFKYINRSILKANHFDFNNYQSPSCDIRYVLLLHYFG